MPEHIQYGYHFDVEPRGFYGVHSGTQARDYKALDAPEMKAAQCLTTEDYIKLQRWIESVKEIANSQCGGN